jgi:hypothetical protein
MSLTTQRRSIALPTAAPSTPRLRLEPTGTRRTLLDGGWWPRSTDPVAELPGLVLSIDAIRGRVTGLVLSAAGWTEHPRRLAVNDRVLRLGFFASQSPMLLTALCGYNGERIDLLVIPPTTPPGIADASMAIAARTANLIQAQDILAAASAVSNTQAEDTWETEGGSPHLSEVSMRD